MSWLVDWVPGWVKGLFDIAAFVGKLVVNMFMMFWAPLLFLGSLIAAAWSKILELFDLITSSLSPVLTIVVNSATFARSAAESGWPPELSRAFFYANQYVPLGELMIALGTVALVFTLCIAIRTVKSCLPTVN